ncbi:MAG: hypothetical protein ACOC6A_00760 [Chloroflexota bacterium]
MAEHSDRIQPPDKNGNPLKRKRRALAALVLFGLLCPLAVVQFIPTDSPQPYVFDALIQEELAQSNNGELTFLLVEWVAGKAPAQEFVVTISRSYTRGESGLSFRPGEQIWMQGTLMDPETYYGEQYLFFGRPQVYVRQVKDGLLWPDQKTELRILYLSPVHSLSSPVVAAQLPRSEEFAPGRFAVALLKSLVIGGTAVYLVRFRRDPMNACLTLAGYACLMMVLTILVLTDLY